MKNEINQLREFHKAFHLPMRNKLTIIPKDEFILRHRILQEEVDELSDGYFNKDIVEVADAITDCMYVLIGTALQFGIVDKLEACFNEVHRSNMSKLDESGNPVMREDGKVMKSSLYFRPDLESIISSNLPPSEEKKEEAKINKTNFPYCNNNDGRCSNPKMEYSNGQFVCPVCGSKTKYSDSEVRKILND